MRVVGYAAALVLIGATVARLCIDPQQMDEPVAFRQEPVLQTRNNGTGEPPPDFYAWMRDDNRSRPDVLAYLDAENAYADEALAALSRLTNALADEMGAPLPEVEWRAPKAAGAWEYAQRRGPGDDYWDVMRRPAPAAAAASGGDGGRAAAAAPAWRTAAPFNRLARAHQYFDVVEWHAAPDGAALAFSVDTRGDEEFSVYVLPLAADGPAAAAQGETGDQASGRGDRDEEGVSNSGGAWEGAGAPVLIAKGAAGGGQAVWAPDSRSLFVLEQPGSSKRQGGSSTRVWRRAVAGRMTRGGSGGGSKGKAAAPGDAVLLELDPGALDLDLTVSSSGQFLILKYGAEDGDAVLALDMVAASGGPGIAMQQQQQREQRPSELARAVAAGWRVVLDPDLGRDCMQADHWRDDVFLLIVDDEDEPDGRVELAAVPRLPAAASAAAAAVVRQPLLVSAGGAHNGSGGGRSGGSGGGGGGGGNGGFREGHVEVRSFALTRDYAAVSIRRGGACVVQVFDWQTAATALAAAAAAAARAAQGGQQKGGKPEESWPVPLPAPAWELSFGRDATAVVGLVGESGAFEVPKVRLSEESFVSPVKQYDLDLQTRERALVYAEKLAGSFQEERYESRMEWATSHDGVKVPMTVAWRRDKVARNGANPAILHGYGAYGAKKFPGFDPADLALLDRGFVLAVGHIRGGSELGAAWHSDGERMHKMNTFHDLLACARHLVASNYTSPPRLALWGRSAGGLAVGAALNLDPACCGAAVLDVPFLDPLRTMLDASLLLTVKERPEWGDPIADEAAFDYISSYSPYDNVQDAPYPSLLVTASLWDRRVNFWEPLKYVAKLRHLRQLRRQSAAFTQSGVTTRLQDARLKGAAALSPHGGGGGGSDGCGGRILMKTDMAAGHFAASGAGERLRQRAEKAAFLVDALGLGG
ncbi:oligopeptidase B [Monoraphidium neglectum]|uniref:Prolyl endopeptidase-like n=1 Tax=Monoraphidium neglectum TaxID=145388 RepID=A0A0D2NT01_9CHLO|nr:oligopeptidase B [Monoraphidium neglectum]KIZ07341.1 oligopeptidase B [Monoraphidium neglectum]|eukprot:XP_013906360.1 oligopeptidase B [Monoraphidium neglectum]